MRRIWAALGSALAIGAVVLPTASRANTVPSSATFSQTSDDSSNNQVGSSSANNITVTDLFNGFLQIEVNLASDWGLVSTGASKDGSLVFGLSGISTLTFGAIDPTSFQGPAKAPDKPKDTWYPTGTTSTLPVTSVGASSADLKASGKYEFTSGYGMSYDSNGGSGPFSGLEFTITNSTTDLDLLTFLADLQSSTAVGSTGLCDTSTSSGCFYVDATNASGKTGLIDFGDPVTSFTTTTLVTPLPAALPLFATGLGALGLFGWRRKRKTAMSAA